MTVLVAQAAVEATLQEPEGRIRPLPLLDEDVHQVVLKGRLAGPELAVVADQLVAGLGGLLSAEPQAKAIVPVDALGAVGEDSVAGWADGDPGKDIQNHEVSLSAVILEVFRVNPVITNIPISMKRKTLKSNVFKYLRVELITPRITDSLMMTSSILGASSSVGLKSWAKTFGLPKNLSATTPLGSKYKTLISEMN